MATALSTLSTLLQRKRENLTALSTEYAAHVFCGGSRDKASAVYGDYYKQNVDVPEHLVQPLSLSTISVKEEPALVAGTLDNLSPVTVKKEEALRFQLEHDMPGTYLEWKNGSIYVHAVDHVSRRRYVRVLGTLLHRVEASGRVPVAFNKVQLNFVIAVGCLGFHFLGDSIDMEPELPRGDPDLASASDAVNWQFLTFYDGANFVSSYYDLLKGRFAWAPVKKTPFLLDVLEQEQAGSLQLRRLNLDEVNGLDKTQDVFVDFAGPGCFFGTAGDVQAKASLLPPGSDGIRQLRRARIYFVRPEMLRALSKKLSRRTRTPVPAAALKNLPLSALRNFNVLWGPALEARLRDKIATDEGFAPRLLHSLPEMYRLDTLPSSPSAGAEELVVACARTAALSVALLKKALA